MDTQALRIQIGITGRVMMRNAEGISHEESLKPAAPGASCMNWVAGHLCRARAQLVQMLGQESPFPPEDFAMYHGGTQVPFNTERAIPFDDLIERFNAFEKPIQTGLQSFTPEQAAEKAPFSPTGNPDETVGSLLATFAFHEAYHVGQAGVLRRVVGKPGQLTPPGDG